MLTTVQVRNDLKEIRYYYSMKELFDRSSKTVKPLAIVQKVERYNTAMQNAPARLYILYVSLYIDNNTQAVLAVGVEIIKITVLSGYGQRSKKYVKTRCCKTRLRY